MFNYSSIYPSERERRKPLKDLYSDDSDEEKFSGPPKLSNFAAALLSEKENENPNQSYKRRDGQVHHQNLARFTSSNSDSLSGNLNQNTMSQTYVSTHSGEPSQSTIFAQSKGNQQPSMTTINTKDIDAADKSDLEKSFSRIKSKQQSMREELTLRHAERRSRRFLKSNRIGLLGPAKRSSSNTAAEFSDLSVGNFEAIKSDAVDSDSITKRNYSHVIKEKTFDTDHRSVFNQEKNINISQEEQSLVELGTLNPVQYLKKYNLPSSELPMISRIYFERQREENHQIALQKHISSREAVTNRVARSFSSTSSLNNSLLRENSAPASNPRRKLSDTSVSFTSRAALVKTASSPLVESSTAKAAFLEDAQSPSVVQQPKQDVQKTYDQHIQNTLNNSFRKREALANIDINRSSQESTQPPKRFKPLKNDLVPSVEAGQPIHQSVPKERNESSNRDYVKTTSVKRVEIIEPKKTQAQSRRNFVRVNEVEYEKVELLGRGGSSKVYKVKDNENKVYALKRVVFDEFDDSSVDGFKGEIQLLKRLENQKRVVKLIDHEMDHGVLFLIMECGDHDLSQILNQRADMPLDIEFVRYHAREMLKCVKVVHDSGIVHSDLKPANFVLVKGILKIIDFGIANAVPDHTVNIYRETQIGTPNYMAPEALVAMNYAQPNEKKKQQSRWKVGKPSDIWSCGCIIYQMIYGRPPYGGFQGQNRLLAIMNPDVKIVFSDKTPHDQTIPRSALDLMKACLSRNPEKRWAVNEVLESSFLKPVMVTPFFIRDLIKNAVKYGSDQNEVSPEKVDELAEDVLNRLEDFRL